MKIVILCLLACAVLGSEMLVSKDYVDELKTRVTWEVEDYESNIFKGWTVEDAENFLGLVHPEPQGEFPEHQVTGPLPRELSWLGANCTHEVRNQGNCGSCWAFAATGMLTDRCCLHTQDQGWLAPQELVSCEKQSSGCSGGYMQSPISYMQQHGGLVHEECFPYQAKDLPCPSKCVDGKSWKDSHVCKCTNAQSCGSVSSMQSCLKSGPVTYSFMVCQSFFSYRSGIYKCDCSSYLGGHAVLAVGYSDQPECHFVTKNSWSHVWGENGYFRMACRTCGLSGGMMCGKVTA